jgi:serine protease inhibitor
MPCFSSFCCGYGLRSGGSFVGYFSILVYIKLFVLSVILLLNINNRIDESEGNSNASFWSQLANTFRIRSSRSEIEIFVAELKSETQNSASSAHLSISFQSTASFSSPISFSFCLAFSVHHFSSLAQSS